MSKLLPLVGLFAMAFAASGCALLAAAGLGVMAHDEATEEDGEFDPLEKVEDEIDDDDDE